MTDITSRPSSHVVLHEIEALISADSAKYYITLDEPYQCFNVGKADLKSGGTSEQNADPQKDVIDDRIHVLSG